MTARPEWREEIGKRPVRHMAEHGDSVEKNEARGRDHIR